MIRHLGTFLIGSLSLWLLTFLPVYLFWDEYRLPALLLSPLALGLCLVPALVTLVWGLSGAAGSQQQQILVVFGGMALRMFFVLGLGLLCTLAVPFVRQNYLAFWLWVLVYYLGTLGLEITIVARALLRAGRDRAGQLDG